jgi:DNA-binding response OmpR family regulator
LGCSRIHEATDGESGLEAIHTLAPDLVLLDWELPGMGGACFVRRLRGAGLPGKSVPVIILVGREERSRVLEAVRLGVHEFLLKPVSSGALEARLLSILSRSPAIPEGDRRSAPTPRKLAS